VITLGQSLKMITTAEGVETLEQLTFLAGEGCEQVQGYYFGRPTAPEQMTKLIGEWKRLRATTAA
jgi:EAL domain-containing protein (putative c-di-GMP-specific phosphodiesterase class I)